MALTCSRRSAIGRDALERVADRQAGHRTVPAFGKRSEYTLDDVVGHKRSRGVVDEDHERIIRHFSEAGANRVAPFFATGDAGAHLAATLLFSEQDRRLLPTRWRDEDDRVDPRARVEAAE